MIIYVSGAESRKKEVGAPALPDVSRSIIIPDDTEMRVNIIASSFFEVEDIDIAPSKGFILRTVNPFQYNPVRRLLQAALRTQAILCLPAMTGIRIF